MKLGPHREVGPEELFLGGKGSLIPFNPNPTKPSATPSPASADPNVDPMQGAVDQIERALYAKVTGPLTAKYGPEPADLRSVPLASTAPVDGEKAPTKEKGLRL